MADESTEQGQITINFYDDILKVDPHTGKATKKRDEKGQYARFRVQSILDDPELNHYFDYEHRGTRGTFYYGKKSIEHSPEVLGRLRDKLTKDIGSLILDEQQRRLSTHADLPQQRDRDEL